MRHIRNLPNGLSISRIVMSLLLPVLPQPGLFVAGYLLCGLSDLLDGLIARGWGVESALGARLDSIADSVFWAVVFALALQRVNGITKGAIGAFCVVLALRATNLLITKIKYGRWGMLHSWGNKATGLLLYFLLPVYVVKGAIAFPALAAVFLVALLSALDEMAILQSNQPYQVNRKCYFYKG